MASSTDQDYVEIDFDYCLAETTKAVRLAIRDNEVWVPKSLINGDPPDVDDENGVVEVPEWWAMQEELI